MSCYIHILYKLELDKFKNELKFDSATNNNLEKLVEEYQLTAEQCLGIHAPTATKRVIKKLTELWYNNRISDQKKAYLSKGTSEIKVHRKNTDEKPIQ